MKKLILFFSVVFGSITANAQNPFAEYGYTPKIATLSQGQYNEFHDQDTIVQIGSVLFNTQSDQIVAFVEYDTLHSEATLEPDIVSRWISPDPLADHPNQIGMSPYSAMWNNPIIWNDPDGRCPWCIGAIVGAVTDIAVQAAEIYLDDNKTIDDFSITSVGISAGAGALGVGIATKLSKASTLIRLATEVSADAAASAGTQMAKDGHIDGGDVLIDAVVGQTIGKAAGDIANSKFLKSGKGQHLQEKVNEQVNASLGKSNTISKSKANVSAAENKLTREAAARSVGASNAASGTGSTIINETNKALEDEK